MNYDIVIPTRNRLDALRMSLPLIGRQIRLPQKLIIVDSSDDPSIAVKILSELDIPKTVELILVRSDRANASHQRNLGLQRVLAPVTMFPDDDSLWFPDTADSVMKIYEADAQEAIGGISSTQTGMSPVEQNDLAYKVDLRLLMKKRFDPIRNQLEDSMIEPPYRWFSRRCPAFANLPDWAVTQGLPSLGTMTGFRMSFRTHLARENGFDADLGHKSGWCLWEDADLSLRVLASGKCLVAAPNSRVFHHSFPSRRANGFDYGFSQIANYAYVCCKVMPRTSDVNFRLERYLRYKLMLYRFKRDDYGRDVYRGALTAWKLYRTLWDAPREQIGAAFRAMCEASPNIRT